MNWSFSGNEPIYAQLIRQIQESIVAGAYSAGARLPSVRELAAEAGVNPNTMQRALQELEHLGLVESHRTAGRFVTEDQERIQAAKEQLAQIQVRRFLEAMHRLGYPDPVIPGILAQNLKLEEH